MAGLTIGLIAFLTALRGSSMAPVLVMLTVPLQRWVRVGSGDLHLTWTQVALAGFVGGALILLLRGGLEIPVDIVTIASLGLVSVYALTVVVTESISAWAGESYRWVVAVAFLALARPYATMPGATRNLAIALSVLALAAAITAVGQVASDVGPASFERSGLTRAFGAFGEPNPFGAFAVLVTLPCLARLVRPRVWRGDFPAWLAAVGGLAGIGAIALSQSRGAFLGLAAGGVILALTGWAAKGFPHRRAAITVAAAGAAILAIIAAVLFEDTGRGVDVTSANWAERERRAHWGAAARMVVDHPVLGIGAGGFDEHFRGDTTEWRFRISQGHAHNAYLQVAAETGVIGLAAYLGLLGALIWRLLARQGGDWRSWGALAVTAAVAVHGIFDYLHVLSLGIVLSGIWANGLAGAPRGIAPGEHNPFH